MFGNQYFNQDQGFPSYQSGGGWGGFMGMGNYGGGWGGYGGVNQWMQPQMSMQGGYSPSKGIRQAINFSQGGGYNPQWGGNQQMGMAGSDVDHRQGSQWGYNGPNNPYSATDPNINLLSAQQGGPTGANRPGMQYRQDRRQARQGGNEMAQAGQPQGGAPSWYEAGSFDTPFGNLVQSSVGNGNIYKQNGSDGQSLYHYDPTQGWKHMTQQEYMGYNNPADFYQDPNQYAAAAGGNKSQMQMRNGMYQTMLGTGTYR